MSFDTLRGQKYIEVMPAYGRDYKNKAEVQADWDEGKDFIETTTRRYCSKRDFGSNRYSVTARYGNLRKVMNLK
jgi:hypothetical protein